jgi:hypothetical protein
MPDDNHKTISKILDSARRKLVETGTRNRLIHVNRANQRANFLNVINERSDDIYSLLRNDARRMRLKAMGKDKAEGDVDTHLALPDVEQMGDAERYTDNFIETPLGPEALARRLLRLANDAKTAEEEQGLNILYLAMGFLRWRESTSSEIQREAPLILLPVQLVRNERTSTYDIQSRDDDIVTNLPLQERLRQDFGIVLPEIEEAEGWKPSNYFARVIDAVSGQPSWSVDENGMQVGFFSFAKLLMHRDLDLTNWPEGAFSENHLLFGLLAGGFEADTPLFGPEDNLDEHLDPAHIIQVIDADASQTKVIEEVRRGASLVVQGPPGTGKSQTITNIIAAAAHDGKTVLFVAEKMAALSVVHERLVKVGLRDICLELHSRTANKKALAQELGRTLSASARALPIAADPAKLRLARDELNRITTLLHTPIAPSNDSPFRAISEIIGFIGAGVKPPSIPQEGLEKLDFGARQQALAAISAFVEACKVIGQPEAHPFRGTKALELQPTELSRLEDELAAASKVISEILQEAAQLAQLLNRPEPATLAEISALSTAVKVLASAPDGAADLIATLFSPAGQIRLDEALQAGADWAAAKSAASGKFALPAWSAQIDALRVAIVRGQASFLSRLFGPYRRASEELASLLSGPLPKTPTERLAFLDELAEIQNLRKRLSEEEGWLRSQLGPEWRGEATPFSDLLTITTWLAQIKRSGEFSEAAHVAHALAAFPYLDDAAKDIDARIQACCASVAAPITRLQLDLEKAGVGGDIETAPLNELAAIFWSMAADTARYGDWARLEHCASTARSSGAGSIVDAVTNGKIVLDEVEREFTYACAEARWNTARTAYPELNNLPQLDRHDLVHVFRKLEKDRIDTTKVLILSRHFEQMPRGTMGEMGVIRGEIGRKRGHKPIRWVMKNAGGMVQRIKPVMLMSPISVAQFLPPGSVSFDLLVIDEASQIRPEDALGVVARAKQIVVVGDQKQLPPTSFFDRLIDDAEESDDEDEDAPIGATAADMESILSLCEARGLRSRMLEWHYRSRDPSLIRVSNAEFYGDNLVLPPSPLQLDEDYGLKFHRVPGIYARGGNGVGRKGTNRIEAEAVVRAMAAHARTWPDLSLGVVAFSKTQADMLTEVLELERRRDSVLDNFLREGRHEDVFVKNIENVQGDERDVILISVGYGPQEPNGRLISMSFGPVNGEGGERRLNVLFSRARVRCEVFASFDPCDIDPARAKRDGPRILKRFLDFAKTGDMEERVATGAEADSPFEEDVATVIRSLGYLADPQVGTAGFRIDLGVRHPDRPGQYLLAVECDGAAYHSALWARERDRLRQEVLESLGWRFHRIWSTDWFHHRPREIQRLKETLEMARAAVENGHRVRGANHEAFGVAPMAQTAMEEPVDIDHLTFAAPAYVRADLSVRATIEPHDAPVTQLADLIAQIVTIEGPIHIDEITRRLTSAFGKSRAGSRIAEATRRAALLAVQKEPTLTQSASFLLTDEQAKNPPIRDRSAENGSLLKAAYLPPMEISAAAQRIRSESGDMAPEELTRAIARLLGFRRVGSDLAVVISEVVNSQNCRGQETGS